MTTCSVISKKKDGRRRQISLHVFIFYFLGLCSRRLSLASLTALLPLELLLLRRKLDSTTTGEGDEGLLARANSEDVLLTSSEGLASKILNIDNSVRARVLLDGLEKTNTTQVVTASDHDEVTETILDVVLDLSSGEVDLDGVVDLDVRVGVADGAAIVGGEEGDTLGAKLDAFDLAELEAGLLGLDAVESKAALDVEQETEVLASALNGDDIHEASGEGGVGADLTVDLDNTLLEDEGDLTAGEGVFEAVAEEHDQRKALTELVGASRGAGSLSAVRTTKAIQNTRAKIMEGTYEDSTHLVEHPVRGSVDTLEVLLGSTRLAGG